MTSELTTYFFTQWGFLGGLTIDLIAELTDEDAGFKIDWFGELKPLGNHLLHLCDHKTLHHGQWMTYRAILGGKFPESWRVFWGGGVKGGFA